MVTGPIQPSPVFTGEEARREAVGGEGLYRGVSKTLTSQAFGLGPSSPAKSGRGIQAKRLRPLATVIECLAASRVERVRTVSRDSHSPVARCGVRVRVM